MALQKQLESGILHHQAGRLAEAERFYRLVLSQQPNHAKALQLLGVLAGQMGQLDAAVELIRQAIEIKPDDAEAHCNLGFVLQNRGQPDESIACYNQAIRLKPDFAEAHYSMGVALQRKGQKDLAIAAYRRVIWLKPDYAEAYSNLGNVFTDRGQFEEAIAAYRQAILLKPGLAEIHYNIGIALQRNEQFDEAIQAYHQAVQLKPDFANAYNDLGNALTITGHLNEAIAACRKAIWLKPDFAVAKYNLGVALQRKGQLDDAIESYHQAICLKPDYAEPYNNLGIAFQNQKKLREAIDAYHQAIRLKPDYAEAYGNLGNALKEMGQSDEAIAAYRQAIRLGPDLAESHNNLGNALKDNGELDEAISCYRQAIRLNPGYQSAHSSLLFTLNYHPDINAQTILAEHRAWADGHTIPLMNGRIPYPNQHAPDRRLRVGYVSGDFRRHPVGYFLIPLLEYHDREVLEVFCYANIRNSDNFTDRIKRSCGVWRNIFDLADEAVAQLIHSDGIDILVDLSGHTAGNRLRVFARKPAPVQVTYLAYCSTTGLDAIDYRLSDPYLDPPSSDETCYSEKTVRLPESYWCYQPIIEPTGISLSPASKSGFITFGCLSNFCKVTESTLMAWAKLMLAIPASQLLIHSHEGSHRRRVQERLEQEGIERSRVRFAGHLPIEKYFDLYGQIDIALDTFPYGGGTTTCDALWMGVPVISLMGKTAVGRGGWSILSNVGLPELVARSEEEYVQIAIGLANDLPLLNHLRSTLRQRMEQSPLMDAPGFARNIEAAYRLMWRNWCGIERV